MKNYGFIFLLLSSFYLPLPSFAQAVNGVENPFFKIEMERNGIKSLFKTHDLYPTNYIFKGRLLGEVLLRYQFADGSIDSLNSAESGTTTLTNQGKQVYAYKAKKADAKLQFAQRFVLRDDVLSWNIEVTNSSGKEVTINDFVIPIFYNNQNGEQPKEIFEQQVIKHHYIEGDNSYLFFERPTGVAPYLLLTPKPGTPLEYMTKGRYFQVYIHSALTGTNEKRGNWRQAHTSTTIKPGATIAYAFNLQWAKSYEDIRTKLFDNELIDVHVAPGMTIPSHSEATFALHTKTKINGITAEFPANTKLTYLGEKRKNYHIYKVKFDRLGENKLTIKFGGNRKTYLEFFSTEPLETLYKKRASFLVSKQQIKDPGKWWDGVYAPWDMSNKMLRTPNDTADFPGRLKYVLTADDPGLSKAPFLAAKNVIYPNKKEIESIEYYVENFVWGKLQRTDQEFPNPYGVYGTPNWSVNRNREKQVVNLNDTAKFKMHIWRSYDYPHIFMLYFHLYQIATYYPEMVNFRDKAGYLKLASETAKAFFNYPYEILPWYETYKWGCYNELVLLDIISALQKEGHQADANELREGWEKKVKYFIYDDPYPFRSEYAVDATAFESSHALAAYAINNEMKPDSNLWYDKNAKKYRSHPVVSKDSARKFMDRQIEANIALRGWLEPTYYFYGSDFRGKSDSYTLSYMSQMGGWAILDYALNYAKSPADYFRLGYASYLSSFALMNTGTEKSGYGFWYPGKENDGATGWAFEPQKFSGNWLLKKQGRGPWVYDGEIDLGYGGATRAAATIVVDDPVFGLMAYGGDLELKKDTLSVVPKDGLRIRLANRALGSKLDIEFNRDGFAENLPILLGKEYLSFTIENRTLNAHETTINLSGLPNGSYELAVSGKKGTSVNVRDQHKALHVKMTGLPTEKIVLKRSF